MFPQLHQWFVEDPHPLRRAIAEVLVALGFLSMPITAIVTITTDWPVPFLGALLSLIAGFALVSWPIFLGFALLAGTPLLVEYAGIDESALIPIFPFALVCVGIGIAGLVSVSDRVQDLRPSPAPNLPRAIAREK